MLRTIKDILLQKRKRFDKICKSADLKLSYASNKEAFPILEDIFLQREYSDYFPFYEKVTIVDIGAHYGYFSIFASKNTDKASNIYSVEPSISNFEILQENIKNCKATNVKPFQLAIGEKEGTGELYEGPSVNHSLLVDYPLLNKGKNTSTVDILDLNSFFVKNNIDKIDFLKLDCEGAEYPILLNASQEVLAKINIISMEFHDLKDSKFTGDRLAEKLQQSGFEILKYYYCKTSLNLNYGKLIVKRK